MIFEKGYLYHIYNQGNNRQTIFFSKKNYLFFLKKIEIYVKPYADIVAYCLMPNHFHLMVLVNRLTIGNQKINQKASIVSQGYDQSETLPKPRTFNDSIGIMLRSYTRAINKQKGFTGALFRKQTKNECINCPKGLTPSFINNQGIVQIKNNNPEFQYPQICFNYIHQNPVKAGLVKLATAWEFSSAKDYLNQSENPLVCKSIAKDYGLF